jgi:nitrate reductase gamma subunit
VLVLQLVFVRMLGVSVVLLVVFVVAGLLCCRRWSKRNKRSSSRADILKAKLLPSLLVLVVEGKMNSRAHLSA